MSIDPEFHPLANIFPILEGEAMQALQSNIMANGLLEPIIMFENKILDGRNRFLACNGKIDMRFLQFEGADPLAFVIAKNLHRRHLNESQRAMVADRLATMPEGRPTKTAQICAVSQEKAAELLHVSRRGVQSARTVREHGTQELVASTERGDIAVSVAAKLAKAPTETQMQAVASPDKAPHLVKKHRRAERELALGQKIAALPDRQYGVVVEDYEWDFKVHDRDTGMDRHAANHYPVSESAHTPEEIVERTKDRAACAADDCAWFAWTTVPHLQIALDVMRLRGFRYVSNWVWDKQNFGTGYWSRNRHEILLLGIKGTVPCPAEGDQWESLLSIKATWHSAKPDAFLEMIEQYFPNVPKIELNRRGAPRPGWDGWGYEAQAAAAE
jgi:N6-adenosine-specific RNA methylase IME4